MEKIRIVGARTHNLKNITVDIPKNKLTVVTGLSGSGKSSLAFDTLFAEGQRRYMESLSSYVRQFLSDMEKPDFDYIEGLAPAIAIDQKTSARNPRSTVATVTEIYDFMRLLYARVGDVFCPRCGEVVKEQKIDTIADLIFEDFTVGGVLKTKIFAPIVRDKKGEHKFQIKTGKKHNVSKVRYDGVEMDLEEALNLDVNKQANHNVEFLIATFDFPVSNQQSIDVIKPDVLKAIQRSLSIGGGMVIATSLEAEPKVRFYSQRHACHKCGWQFPEIEPKLFSFNNPHGACPICQGLGLQMVAEPDMVIPNPRLTIAEGAIRPWSRTTSNSSWQQKVLTNISEKYNFSLNTPVEKLSEETMKIVLYGEGDSKDEDAFEGVIPNLEKRYQETDSDYLKNEIEKYMVEKICTVCHGQRLRPEALSIKINDKNIVDIVSLNIEKAKDFFDNYVKSAQNGHKSIANILVREISLRLGYLLEVGLSYLTLDRTTSTLAGGEAQRIRLATQLSSGLTGIVYILDEPSIGLHSRDHQKLLRTILDLRDKGNTVVVVEHDRDTMIDADYIIDMGPGAGEQGGSIIAQGTPEQIKNNPQSITGDYLSNRKTVTLDTRHEGDNGKIVLEGATGNNLKDITVSFPLNKFICITGVSGSGKSTLISDTLARILEKHFHQNQDTPSPYTNITGLENIDNIINIDQSPIGRTPRSNPATYTGALGPIRELFALTIEAQNRGYDPSRFSFNLRGGRCENCRGDGQIKIEMNFMPDAYVPCEECKGRRFNAETLEVKYKGKDISEVLAMTIDEAYKFFDREEEVAKVLEILKEMGLGYMKLGQSATTLSGGEAQRIKLAAELSKKETGRTLYILDEPTSGLHFEDIQRLLKILSQLVDRGNTVMIIEHNLDVIKCADWIIDLGPEGGDMGGTIVAEGTPEEIRKNKNSYTGKYLDILLSEYEAKPKSSHKAAKVA